MLSKKQLEDAAKCEERLCRGCEMLTDNAGYCAQAVAQTALALADMLKRLERVYDSQFNEYFCPICKAGEEVGHFEGCELAKVLKGLEG